MCNYRCNRSPALPQGESYGTESLMSSFINCRGVSPQAGRGDWKELFILKIEIILNFKILLISFLA